MRLQVVLLSMLDPCRADGDFKGLTWQQQMNVMVQVLRFDEMAAADPKWKHEMAVVDAGRNPEKEAGVDSDLKLDRCATFRTNN